MLHGPLCADLRNFTVAMQASEVCAYLFASQLRKRDSEIHFCPPQDTFHRRVDSSAACLPFLSPKPMTAPAALLPLPTRPRASGCGGARPRAMRATMGCDAVAAVDSLPGLVDAGRGVPRLTECAVGGSVAATRNAPSRSAVPALGPKCSSSRNANNRRGTASRRARVGI